MGNWHIINNPAQNELDFINAFVAKKSRLQYINLLTNHKKRKKILNLLYHSFDFEPHTYIPIDSKQSVVDLLLKKGSDFKVQLLGTKWDRQLVDIKTAYDLVEMQSGIIICIPNKLGYYCSEIMNKNTIRYLLFRIE